MHARSTHYFCDFIHRAVIFPVFVQLNGIEAQQPKYHFKFVCSDAERIHRHFYRLEMSFVCMIQCTEHLARPLSYWTLFLWEGRRKVQGIGTFQSTWKISTRSNGKGFHIMLNRIEIHSFVHLFRVLFFFFFFLVQMKFESFILHSHTHETRFIHDLKSIYMVSA